MNKIIARSGILIPPIIRKTPMLSAVANIDTQVKSAHTDLQTPDFTNYRKDSTKNPNRKTTPLEQRTNYHYLMIGTGFSAGVLTAKGAVHTVVDYMAASAAVAAAGQIEVNLDEIPEGKSVLFKWRGKPLFIRHRTGEEIQREQAVNVGDLRDPQKDEDRVKDPAWLVVIGVCTHLGCVPIANSGDFGGYYCPCHGSHYDASGRIRKGPAPLNLEVPEHEFRSNILVVG